MLIVMHTEYVVERRLRIEVRPISQDLRMDEVTLQAVRCQACQAGHGGRAVRNTPAPWERSLRPPYETPVVGARIALWPTPTTHNPQPTTPPLIFLSQVRPYEVSTFTTHLSSTLKSSSRSSSTRLQRLSTHTEANQVRSLYAYAWVIPEPMRPISK